MLVSVRFVSGHAFRHAVSAALRVRLDRSAAGKSSARRRLHALAQEICRSQGIETDREGHDFSRAIKAANNFRLSP